MLVLLHLINKNKIFLLFNYTKTANGSITEILSFKPVSSGVHSTVIYYSGSTTRFPVYRGFKESLGRAIAQWCKWPHEVLSF